ncbi:hypothetical protein [Sphingobacterium corticibacterium]|uniref:Uncharacterized protein n=1 Tax=Sphingobacterium corticibacterium TaxID=2484746 RepID=A0A4Q6XPL2_9SPHI|nr:hypothetical protein [Sphingobacterium corticibacterium]RZF58066.1 hypothetical protein EWE74_18570 [Sphingobacterium corticibacterium]
MKKNLFVLVIILLILPHIGVSQSSLTTPKKGSKIYVAGVSKNEDAIQATDKLIGDLKDWSYWELKSIKDEADFILEVDIKTSKGVTLTSWGGTSYRLVAQIMDKGGDVLWESSEYKASPNGTNGFNAANAVVKKFMRALKKKIEQ